MSNWEQVRGTVQLAWVCQQLDVVGKELRTQIVDGDETVRALVQDMLAEVEDLSGQWQARIERHSGSLGAAWFLDENAYSAAIPGDDAE